ncbi:geranylgeranyl reductase family protein [Micromonospora soli]|uniref:geranylgeranyl reductase family protein n=1 Tax=Micromonospora sp. NBRC 110009 TaxID=3061627 RepID=UPI00267193C7|nr:geranylgeranyl reductase family protein [Micromonospora sp. NBRC 110009]WKT97883.1 geranylgeranyl reductase family protein [Micromonospora sp. NBRC 110009]
MIIWDLVVVGGGPAGLSAAHAAARAGVRTLVIERATHPRYKTCGGGLIGTSLAEIADRIEVPVDDRVDRITVTRDGRRAFTRRHSGPLLAMVRREKFDDRLRAAAVAAGAEVREGVPVRAVEQDPDEVRLRLADGDVVRARTVIGADGSSGVTARHVGVTFRQVDLGLEVELPVPPDEQERWRGRVLLDWGPVPGSYAWVFPKGDDRLTVGVISARGAGERTRAYLRDFVARLGLSGLTPEHDSGHLTRCRAEDAPLRRGRVLVAGDAAGLLEPWSREGISYALRSGRLAGEAVAGGDPAAYEREVHRQLVPAMRAGHRLLEVFERRPDVIHALLATPPGWRMFVRFCHGRTSFEELVTRGPVRAGLALVDRLPPWRPRAAAAPDSAAR